MAREGMRRVNKAAAEIARSWLDVQNAFWTAASANDAFDDASAFAPPDWLAFDGAILPLLDLLPEDAAPLARKAHAAGAAYRDVICATWVRIRRAFDVHRRAVQRPTGPPDWRMLRDRWFAIAEAEFIRTLRSPDFLDAQRRALRALVASWDNLPKGQRDALRTARAAGMVARQTLLDLNVDGIVIAATPKREIWRDGRVRLSRYLPLHAAPGLPPVVICHGLIGRQTMTDLLPERSMVRQLLGAGVDVFVIDWGNAGPGDEGHGLEHFAAHMIGAALDRVRAESGVARPVLFGICQGGTMAAVHAADAPGGLCGMITAVAPFDFHADIHDADPAHGLIHVWMRSLDPDDIDGLIAMDGNLSGDFVGAMFNQLNPVRTLAKYAIDMAETAADPAAATTFLAMEKWLADRPNIPGALARTTLVELYQRNALAEGNLRLCGRPVDLGRIDIPVLNIFATDDHIVPAPCARAFGRLVGTVDYREIALPSGHIGAFVSERTQVLLAPAVVAWLAGIA